MTRTMSCFLLPIVVGGAMVLSTVAMAQAPGAKSTSATTIGEGEAIMVSPKTGTVHKSTPRSALPSMRLPWRRVRVNSRAP
jgi:hypothetical protein